MGARCGDLCRAKEEVGEYKVEDKRTSNYALAISQISPFPSVCARYAELQLGTSWLSTEDSYKLSNQKGIYYGEVENGLPNGFGRVLGTDGSFFEGDSSNGAAFTQKGLYIYTDGSFYLGAIRNNKAEGKGKFAFGTDNQLVYEGEWLNDVPHGLGRETIFDGSHYQGSFLNGVKSGQGTFIWPNGDIYKGSFSQGMMEGEGAFESKGLGYEYSGGWHKNKKEGQGVEHMKGGTVVECAFFKGARVGILKVTKDGKTVEGSEIDGRLSIDI